MTASEEKFTAWVDGSLSAEDAADFERSLGHALPKAISERDEARKLGALLRTQWKPAGLTNGDFFTHQLLTQIEAEEGRSQPGAAARAHRGVPFWRMFWIGAVCYGVSALVAVSLLQPVGHHGSGGYYAQVRNAVPGDARISANVIYSKRGQVTVLWLDGLDRVPGESW